MDSFVKQLYAGLEAKNSVLCVGFDPFKEYFPKCFGEPKLSHFEDFFIEITDIIAPYVAVIKPQIGLFEPFGGDAIHSLWHITNHAKQKGLLVILDAKRGDIGTTAQGYADAYLSEHSVINCDCITLNPYMGVETLEPYVKYAENLGKSIAVLVKTSNPGGKDFQNLDAGGIPLWQRIAKSLKPLEERLMDGEMSSLMVVIGATYPEEAKIAREILPFSQFLIPGYGAQGASAIEALSGFVNQGNRLVGGVVNSSRAILYPKGAKEAANKAEWRRIILENLLMVKEDLLNASQIVVDKG